MIAKFRYRQKHPADTNPASVSVLSHAAISTGVFLVPRIPIFTLRSHEASPELVLPFTHEKRLVHDHFRGNQLSPGSQSSKRTPGKRRSVRELQVVNESEATITSNPSPKSSVRKSATR
jgi:hypothetical protein